MKINKHEKFTLKLLVENPSSSNKEIARKVGITSQAVGKIKKQLVEKGFIKAHEVILDYEKLNVSLHAIALIKILPKAHKEFKHHEIDKILQPPNVIRSYSIPQTEVTHIMIYAFKDIEEYDNYFRNLQKELGEFVEIKSAYVFSSNSIIKSSSKNLFLKVLEED